MSKNKNCSRLVVALSSILLLSGCGVEAGELECVICHSNEDGSNSGVSLESGSHSVFANSLVNVNPVANGCVNELLMDANNPEELLFLKLVGPNNTECLSRMPLGNSGVSAGSVSPLFEWVDTLIVDYLNYYDIDNEEGTSDAKIPLNAFQVVRQVKCIAAGVAETEAELYVVQYSQGKLVQSEIEAFVKGGLQSDGFIEKRGCSFELLLQNSHADNNYIRKSRNYNSSITHAF